MDRKIISTLLFMTLMAGIVVPAGTPHIGDWTESVPALELGGGHSPPSGAAEVAGSVFVENRGQVENSEVMFYAASGSIAFTQGSVFLYCAENAQAETRKGEDGLNLKSAPACTSTVNIVKLSFAGANPVLPAGFDPVSWQSNYLMGSNPALWHTGITNYRGVIYRDLWAGVDLVYGFDGSNLKYEFIVHPNADHSQISVSLEGQESICISEDGSLTIDMGGGRAIADTSLDVFYEDNEQEKLGASFVLIGSDSYSFDIIGRDSGRAVVIDPLIYSTFLGGSGFDYAVDVAVGGEGCAYVTGYTDSVNFPTTFGAFETEYNGYAHDVFVTKMGLNGETIAYSTYLGDTAGDYSQAITVDSTGHAYITGYTMSYNYPTTPRAFQTVHSGDTYDAFVTKLSPTGDSLVYSSFLGGYGFDYAYGIAVDANGFAYVTGDTRSFDFPITPNAVMSTFHGQMYGDERDNIIAPDVFVTKFSQLGDSLSYSTYLGKDGVETGRGIAVDSNGYAYVTGLTWSDNFPVSTDPVDASYNGMCDVFVTQLNQAATRILYSTLLGGPGIDVGTGIAIGPYGHVYVTGYTTSIHFPTTPGAYDETHNGIYDAFAAMIQNTGESLVYSTFVGGSGRDMCNDMALDSAGCVYLIGNTESTNFPVTVSAFDATHNGNCDAFLSKVSPSGNALLHSTYLGGAYNDYGYGVDIGDDGFTHVVGDTTSAGYPTTAGVVGYTYGGNSDAFVSKLDITPPVTNAGPDQRIPEGTVVTFDGRGSTDNDGIVNYTWTMQDGNGAVTLYGAVAQHLFAVPGAYPVTLNTSDTSSNWNIDTMNLTVLDITPPVAVAGDDKIADEDTVVSFNGSASTDNVCVTNYTWTFSEGTSIRHLYGPAPTYIYRTPGIYAVELEVLDAAGNSAQDSLVVEISDVTSPVARAGRDRSVYDDNDFTFNGTASSDNVEIVNYTWSLFDGIANVILYGSKATHHFSVPGIYPVTLNVTDAVCLLGTDVMVLTVLETVRPVAAAGPDIVTDEGQPMHFDGSGCTDNVGVALWIWSFFDGQNNVTAFGESAAWVFTVPGVFEVTLNASDAAGNWDTDSLVVTVLDCLSPKAVAGPNHVVLAGSTVTLDASLSSDSSGIVEYVWTFNYNNSAVVLSGAIQSFQFWSPGTYNITLTVQDAVGAQSSSQTTVTVTAPNITAESAPSDLPGWALISLAACLFMVAGAIIYRRRRKVDVP